MMKRMLFTRNIYKTRQIVIALTRYHFRNNLLVFGKGLLGTGGK